VSSRKITKPSVSSKPEHNGKKIKKVKVSVEKAKPKVIKKIRKKHGKSRALQSLKQEKQRLEQEKLHAQAGVVKTADFRVKAVEDARARLARNPDIPKNTFDLAEALSDMQTNEAENEAVELLTGVPAGDRDSEGIFPEGSVNRLVEDRLLRMAHKRRQFSKGADTVHGGQND